jgi:protein-tyrosine-phosphatase
MKILFVCRGNVARSQMAEMIYNNLTNSSDADSAGTHAEKPGETLGQRKKRIGKSYVVDVMNNNNMPIEDKTQTQITKDILKKYDLIIGMSAKKYTPKWLAESPNYIYWKIRDPKARGYSTTNKTRLNIEQKVKELIAKY